MFSEEKEHERRSSERHRDGTHQSFIRHRIPYRLLGRRSLGAKRLVVSSKVLFPAIPTENCDVVLTFPASTEDATLMWLLARLKTRAPALTVHVRHHSHTGIYGFYLTALYDNLLQGAEELGILKPLKSEYGGGMKEFVFEDQDFFAGVEDEASFLTSQERQSIVLHFLHELRATGDDSLEGISFIEGQPIVPLLITKKVISQVFPLHNHKDLKTLRKTWVQAIFSRQPLDAVCQYFGVKIGLYFAYLGHYTTWLILPALVGLVIFLLQGPSQQFDDLCFVAFALFNTVWATLYLKFWNRASTEYCYRWGTLEKKDDMLKDPRPLFKGDLVKSPVTGHLELAYPAWKRLIFRYFVTFPMIAVCLALVFVIMLLCFELQEWVNELISEEELPYIFSFVPKVLLAVVVSILDEVYKQIAIWLTYKENYRLEASHETSLVIKLVLFQFVNSFLSLFYIGFYLGDMDRLRDQLAALLITRQVLGNIKEALMPYIIWKARLYSVGYQIATRMSPASVEKEVRRMTARSGRRTSSATTKSPKSGERAKRQGEGGKNSDSESSPHTEEDDERLPTLTQAEVESAMKRYEDTLDDYLEMVIQFGYITLFSSAFPLAALCALLNNVIEIRSDAFKLCLTYQRPFGQRVESIGIWQDILLVISVLAVIANCALIGTSGLLERLYPGLSSTVYCIIIVMMEHLIITCKFALYRSIPDFPPVMATEMARLEYQRTEALKQLVTQMAPNHGGGSLISHYPGSPNLRRKRLVESTASEPNIRESSPLATSAADTRNRESSPTVITPTTAVPRPSDIFLNSDPTKYSETTKPAVPPRPSLQKADAASNQPKVTSSYNDVAEKVVAAAMNPLFDSLDLKSSTSSSASPSTSASPAVSSSESSTGTPSSPIVASAVPARLSLHPVMSESRGSSKTMKRVYRKKADIEAWRRRSEPVSLAVKQAISLHQDDEEEEDGGDSRLKRKSIYANKEDLRDSLKDDLSRHGERVSLQDEIKKSRDRLNIMDNLGERHTGERPTPQSKDEVTSCSSPSTPRISSAMTSLPPTAPTLSASSSSLASKYSPPSRFLRGGLLGNPSAFASKILSRKSRSFSSADVNEAKKVFHERQSWRDESPLSKSPPHKSSSKKQMGKEVKKETEYRELPDKSDTSPHVDAGVKNEAAKDVHDEPSSEDVKEVLGPSDTTAEECNSDKPLDEQTTCVSEDRESKKSDSGSKLSLFNRAMRESASKPLSISTKGRDSKGKTS